MNKIEDCYVYEPEINKVTKANSFVASGRCIYVVKKDNTGKAINSYVAYDYETKIQLAWHKDKQFLIDFMIKKDLSVLGGNESLF